MRYWLTFWLLVGLAFAQTAVTLNGNSYNLSSQPRVFLDGCHWTGTWSSGTTYMPGDGVVSSAVNYRAIAGKVSGVANLNKTPASNASYWVADPACNSSNLGVLTHRLSSSAVIECTSTDAAGNCIGSNNPAYMGMVNAWEYFIGSSHTNGIGSGACFNNDYQCPDAAFGLVGNVGANQHGPMLLISALLWYANGADPNDTEFLPVARYLMEHIEYWNGGALGCNAALTACGRSAEDMDIQRLWLPQVAQAYALLSDVLSSADKTHVANVMLNDASEAHGGGGNSASDCTPQPETATGSGAAAGTLNATAQSATTLTGTGTNFSLMSPGDVILVGASGFRPVVVASVQSATSLTLTKAIGISISAGTVFDYQPAWNNNCGYLYYFKYHSTSNPAAVGDYNTAFTNQVGLATSTWTSTYNDATIPTSGSYYHNLFYTSVNATIPVALALASDDARAAKLTQQSFDFYYNVQLPLIRTLATGFNQGACAYGTGRHDYFYAAIAAEIHDSVLSGPDLVGSAPNYVSEILPFFLYAKRPDVQTNSYMLDPYEWPNNCSTGTDVWAYMMAQNLFSNVYSQYVRDWFRNRSGQYVYNGDSWSGLPGTGPSAGQYVGLLYIFYDPTSACTSIDGTADTPATGTPACATGTPRPLQYYFKGNDCSTAYSGVTMAVTNAGCSNWTNFTFQDAVSDSDYTTTATHVMVEGNSNSYDGDHTFGGLAGAFDIYKSGWLLAAGNPADSTNTDAAASSRDNATTVQLGGTSSNQGNSPNQGFSLTGASGISWAAMPRFAGNALTGDSQNRYFYTLVDLNPPGTVGWWCSSTPCITYHSVAGANLGVGTAQRQYIHFKKSGLQDYFVVYDDFEMGTAGYMKAWWHYWQTGNGESNTVSASGTTASVVGASTSLNASYLPVNGANTLALITSNTNCPTGTNQSATCIGLNYVTDGGNDVAPSTKHTYRLLSCASTDGTTCNSASTDFEEMAVFQPLNATTGSMPTLAQPTCTPSSGLSCTAIVIEDSAAPKVGTFTRHNALATSITLNTTALFSGTAQYVLADLQPGSWNVTNNGNPVVSNVTVQSGDNTLYFETTAGPIVATSTATPLVQLSPASVDCGASNVGVQVSCPTSTLTNTGTTDLLISSFTASGDFAQTNNCPINPAALSAGSNCTISPTFTPTVAGARSGSVSIVSNASSSPDSLTLSGTGNGGGGGTTYTLTVAVSTPGGSVSSADQSILNCTNSAGACGPVSYSSGTKVTLTATASQNYSFAQWTGGQCAGSTNPVCTPTLNANDTETASFALSGPANQIMGGVSKMGGKATAQ